MLGTSAPHVEILEGANAVAQARSRLQSAASLVSYDESVLLGSLVTRFARLEGALQGLAQVFEREEHRVRQSA